MEENQANQNIENSEYFNTDSWNSWSCIVNKIVDYDFNDFQSPPEFWLFHLAEVKIVGAII